MNYYKGGIMQKRLIVGLSILVFAVLVVGCVEKNEVKIVKFEDLGLERVKIASGDPGHVPAGKYAAEILYNLEQTDPDLAEKIRDNIVTRDIHVRAVLDKVVLKEVDAGFVYRTDAYTEKEKVRIIEIPEEINVVPEHPVAVLKGSDDREAAAEFIRFVLSREGQNILVKHGFAGAVTNTEPFTPKEIKDTIAVYAAASLTSVFEAITAEFEKMTGGEIKLLFASSGSLRQRIQGGAIGGEAGADVFASASLKHMKILTEEGMVTDYSVFARNEMVVVVPRLAVER
ncbi:molybdate ABC transporter substrate-binding protein [Thermodesulfovibrionales bacterium]|nr:molybdate ABC transporter substrate-binding protein [Thermodesulfovibrionales bacterium]